MHRYNNVTSNNATPIGSNMQNITPAMSLHINATSKQRNMTHEYGELMKNITEQIKTIKSNINDYCNIAQEKDNLTVKYSNNDDTLSECIVDSLIMVDIQCNATLDMLTSSMNQVNAIAKMPTINHDGCHKSKPNTASTSLMSNNVEEYARWSSRQTYL